MSDPSASTHDYKCTPPHLVSVVLRMEPGVSHVLGRHSTSELQLQQNHSFSRRRQSKCDNIFESIKFIPRVMVNPHSWLAKATITLLSLLNGSYSFNTKSTQGSPYIGLQCGC